ncbi:glycosyltransferase family 2 protein [Chromobacterium haemolyticum]|uniref:glycosyltransferase family 2 protein n=1 Tax=Chromobacterium haemolyticum TaxID=394935 RepID=UPI0029543688|nr:glycosyltransferase family 2 protein [Chromobacterium haemolyticum]WON82824.1 glycosyltransferase [Chromobacterium haemolyticum]
MNEPMPENSSPKISIITIVRNDKKGIERTLASVEREKNYLVEYIIIDGASTDGTVETIESHLDIVDNFISEQDNGIYDAMNKGVRLASGDVICMINAGDELEPGAINLVLNSLEIHGSHSIYFGDAYYSYEDTGSKRMVSAQAENIIWKMSICHQAVFIPKSVYYKYGLYSLKYRYAADFDFILRVYMAGERFFYVNGVLAVFIREGQVIKNTSFTD